jgi:hypothetical protein
MKLQMVTEKNFKNAEQVASKFFTTGQRLKKTCKNYSGNQVVTNKVYIMRFLMVTF